MHKEAKYITGVYLERETGMFMDVAIIFDQTMFHSSVARLLRFREIYGAGFVYVCDDAVTVFGRSESLNKDNRGEADVKLIKKALNLD